MAGEVSITDLMYELHEAQEALEKHRNSEAKGLFGVTDWSIKDHELAEAAKQAELRLLKACVDGLRAIAITSAQTPVMTTGMRCNVSVTLD